MKPNKNHFWAVVSILATALLVFSIIVLDHRYDEKDAWEAATSVFTLLGVILTVGVIFTYVNLEKKAESVSQKYNQVYKQILTYEKKMNKELEEMKSNNQTLAQLLKETKIKEQYIAYIKHNIGDENVLRNNVNRTQQTADNYLLANIIKAKWNWEEGSKSGDKYNLIFAVEDLIDSYHQLIDFDDDIYCLYVKEFFNALDLLDRFCELNGEDKDFFDAKLINFLLAFIREDERNREKILSQSEIERYKTIYKKYVDVTTEHRFISVINNENKKRMKLSKVLGLKEKRNTIFKKVESVIESEEKN
ncbi:hypothetical protein NUQ39_06985 [Glaesserella parasuis]|nr:hypothetical protein [Glaesserella parasuis]